MEHRKMVKRIHLFPDGTPLFLRIRCIVLLHLMCFLVTAEVPVVTCYMQSVQSGEVATLTCKFTVNLNAEKPDVLVKRKAFDSSDWTDVLDCYEVAKKYKCDVKDEQFVHISGPSETIVLGLKNSSQATEGDYKCLRLPEKEEELQPCTFNLEPPPSTTVEEEPPKPDADQTGLIVGLVVGSVAVLAIGVIALIIRNKLMRTHAPVSPKKPSQHPVLQPGSYEKIHMEESSRNNQKA